MIINKSKILIFIFIFTILFNIIHLFGLSQTLLSTVLSFAFLLIVPGLLTYSLLKLNVKSIWLCLGYIIGLSISVLMIYGLALNTLLPLYGIKTPLYKEYLLPAINLIVLTLAIINIFIKNHNKYLLPRIKFSILNILAVIIPAILLILTIAGANILNTDTYTDLPLIVIISISIYIIFLVLFSKRITSGLFSWNIYLIALAILLMLSLRNYNVSGSDILIEHKMFELTSSQGFWDKSYPHSYNSCLSITLLPTIFIQFMDVSTEYLFKFYFQSIYAFVPVFVFLFTKRSISNNYAFIGSITYIAFPIFIDAMVAHVRQEIAFFFFSLMILTLFDKSTTNRFILGTLFGLSLIFSHYSTSYVTLILFILTYFLVTFVNLLGKVTFISKKLVSFKLITDNHQKIIPQSITFLFVFILFIATLSWNWLTNPTSNISNFIEKTVTKINLESGSFNESDQVNPLSQFKLFYTSNANQELFNQHLNDLSGENSYNNDFYKNSNLYPVSQVPTYKSSIRVPADIYIFATYYVEIIKKIVKFLLIIGAIVLICKYFRKDRNSREYQFLVLSSLVLLLIFMVTPGISVDYDISRTYQQLLSFSIFPYILGLIFIFTFIPKKLHLFILTSITLSYLLIYTHVIYHTIGGYSAYVQLDSKANQYDPFYLHDSEIASSRWLSNNANHKMVIYGDNISEFKIRMIAKENVYLSQENFPVAIPKYSYVYLNYSNQVNRVFYKTLSGVNYTYNYPLEFLDENKDNVYNNGKSSVYK